MLNQIIKHMIAEDYCSFEVAKLLKEKGFDETCLTSYNTFLSNHKVEKSKVSGWGKANQIYHPTHQMAMKWLREVHQLHISIKPTWVLGDMKEPCRWEYDIISLATAVDLMYYVGNSTYEEAVEAACLYSLENLI